jgi:hypothetical protein
MCRSGFQSQSVFSLITLMCASWLLAGCATETRVVRQKPWFAGLPDAQGDTAVIGMDGAFRSAAFEAAEDSLVTVNPDKTKTLTAKNGRHLMIHIYNTMMEYDRELFTNQVLSEKTKVEFRERGRDPREAFDMLLKQENDIVTLFNLMPQGERTPGFLLEPQGSGVFRVQVRTRKAATLKLVGLDMIMERGNWKLRWFVPGRGGEER